MLALDLSGLRFGRLVAIRRVENSGRNGVSWLCICDCGNSAVRKRCHLVNGYSKSCGCLAIESRSRRLIDISGRKFGRLTAVGYVGRNRHGHSRWRCQCECGNFVVVSYGQVAYGKVVSCGCYAREMSRAKGLKMRGHPSITGSRSHLWKHGLSSENRAKRRQSAKSRIWRLDVFARDEYTCQLCLGRGGKLAAHHLYSWAEYVDLRFDVHNGLTVCVSHHKHFHDWLGGPRMPCVSADLLRYCYTEKFSVVWYLERLISRVE